MRLLISTVILLLPTAALASPIRLCTGAPEGNYAAAGGEIQKMAGKAISITVVNTDGTIDNLERLLDLPADHPEACDAMIGQPDGPAYIARKAPAKVKKLRQVAELHDEYLQVLCGRASGVDDLSDLEGMDGASIAIGEVGSGSWLVWQNIIAEDADYGRIVPRDESGALALSAVAAGDTTCMVVSAALGYSTVQEADNLYGDRVRLVDADDSDFNDAVNIKGEDLYTFRSFSGVYPRSLQTGWGTGVDTIAWRAAVYVNVERVSKADLSGFITAANRAAVGIKAEFNK